MTKTHAYGAEIVNDIARQVSATHQVVLFEVVGTADETSTPFTERGLSDGYSRQDMTTTNFGDISTDGSIANTAAITFTSTNAWSNPIAGAGIRRISDGQLIDFQAFGSPKTVGAGETIKFDPGDFNFSET